MLVLMVLVLGVMRIVVLDLFRGRWVGREAVVWATLYRTFRGNAYT